MILRKSLLSSLSRLASSVEKRRFKTRRQQIVALTVLACLTPMIHHQAKAQEVEAETAKSLMTKKKWPEAIELLKKEAQYDPGNVELVSDLAKALLFSGRREESLDTLRKAAAKQGKEKRELLLKRARISSRTFLTNTTFQIYQDGLNLLWAKRFKPARERFEKVLETEPDNAEILTRLGQCLLLEGDFQRAIERLEVARKLTDQEPEVRLWLGRALHHKGLMKEALAELSSVQKEIPDSEKAVDWLADTHFAVGQKSQAIRILEQDLKIHPLHVSGLVALAKFKYSLNGRDIQQVWSVRKDLQVAQSRLEKYSTLPRKIDSDFGLYYKNADETALEIKNLLAKVDERLKAPTL